MASQAAVCLGKEAGKAGATGKDFYCFWRDFSSQVWCLLKNCFPKARCCVKGRSWSLEFRAFQFLSPQLCPAAPVQELRVPLFCFSEAFLLPHGLRGSWAGNFPFQVDLQDFPKQKKVCSHLLTEDKMMSMVRWNCWQCWGVVERILNRNRKQITLLGEKEFWF